MEKTTERLLFAAGGDFSVDQAAYTTPGTYSLTVPPNVTSVSIVTIQGGQGGGTAGGDGGMLRYINNIAVTPNEVLTVVVGAGGAGGGFDTGLASRKGALGGHSSVSRGATTLASSNNALQIGTGFFGGTGGTGSTGGAGCGGGGGGAGGYAGNGGNGASSTGNSAQPGDGGGGGGGGANNGYWDAAPTQKFGFSGGSGGGTDIKGQGSSGDAGASYGPSGAFTPPSNGKVGSASTGSGYGYGGGGGYATVSTSDGSQTLQPGSGGGGGAVAIIWPGTVRQFPSTRTADE